MSAMDVQDDSCAQFAGCRPTLGPQAHAESCTFCGLSDDQLPRVEPHSTSALSLLHSRIRHNCYPDLLAFAKQVSTEVDTKIACIDKAINKLARRRRQVQDAGRPYLTYLSRIACLPDAVLLEIFKFTKVHEGAPWKVSAVCRHWRALTLSCSHLWADLWIRAPRYQDKKDHLPPIELQLHRLPYQLEKLGSRPRSAYIEAPGYGRSELAQRYNKEISPLDKAITTFLEEMTKCDTLVLNDFRGGGSLPTPPPTFKHLKRLYIHDMFWIRQVNEKHFFRHTPSLRYLDLQRITFFSPIRFRSTSVTHLTISQSKIGGRTLLDSLATIPGLVSLELGDTRVFEEKKVLGVASTLCLEHLKFLRLSFSTMLDPGAGQSVVLRSALPVRRFVQGLTAPKLEELYVKFVDDDAVVDLLGLVSSAASSLTSLNMHRSNMNRWRRLIKLLPKAPLLRSLSVGPEARQLFQRDDPSINIDRLVRALQWNAPVDSGSTKPTINSSESSRSADPELICPRLETLELHTMFVTLAVLRPMILSRLEESNGGGEANLSPARCSSLKKFVFTNDWHKGALVDVTPKALAPASRSSFFLAMGSC